MMKTREKKPSSLLDEERPALQLSSQQLVSAICVLLVSAAVLFLLGWVVGRYERSYRLSMEGTTDTTVASAADDQADAASWNGTQRSPRADLLNRLDGKTKGEPDIVPVPAPPPRLEQSTTSPQPAEKLVLEPKPTEPTPASPAPTPPEQREPRTEPSTTTPAPREPKPAPEEKPDPVQVDPLESVENPVDEDAASTTDSQKGERGFAVQVQSYGAANGDSAEEYRKRLAKETNLKPELVLSADGKYLQVLVGRTSDEKTAQATCKELRKQKRFSDCFVRAVE